MERSRTRLVAEKAAMTNATDKEIAEGLQFGFMPDKETPYNADKPFFDILESNFEESMKDIVETTMGELKIPREGEQND